MGATEGNTAIIQDNLSFIVDPQNYACYPESGTAVTELSVNRESCTLVGGTGFTSPAFTFDGVNDEVDCDTAFSNISSDTTGTIEAWAKPTTAANTEQIVAFGDANGDVVINLINIAGKLRAVSREFPTTHWVLLSDNIVFSDATWCHIAVSQNATSPVIYFNGVAIAQTFTTSTDKTKWLGSYSGLDTMRVGALDYNSLGSGFFFTGSIGITTYHSIALSAAQVLRNYNATKDIYL